MADQKLTELTAATTLAADDLLYAVIDPGGTPASRKISKANIRSTLVAPGGSLEYDSDELKLDGDEDSPGNREYYGTNSAGTKGWYATPPISIGLACSDETSDLTTGDSKITFRMPFAMTLTAVRANVNTAPTGSGITVDIRESGSTVLSTLLTIDADGKTSTTAATPAVISDSALADDAEMAIDIDAVGSTTPGKGLKVWLIGYPA